jgi:hypothetical protein
MSADDPISSTFGKSSKQVGGIRTMLTSSSGVLMRLVMRSFVLFAGLFGALLGAGGASAQGTIPLALQQYVDLNGKPLIGCQLYIYQAGTVSTPQNAFQDFGLTIPTANPMQCDQFGRIPMFWLANGLIHARLLDASGVQQVDVTMQVLGPSSGGGGGGSTVDPTTIAATGDIKFRMTAETVTGWVKLNGTSIGNATSGASGRANSDTQNLFIYLWTNCTNAHCAVSTGRGASALADYNASKTLTLPSWQDSTPIGRDCMDATCAGGLLASNITSGGGDGVDTPGAFGGAANTAIAQTYLPNITLAVTGSGVLTGNVSVCNTPNPMNCTNGDIALLVSQTVRASDPIGNYFSSLAIAVTAATAALGSATIFPTVTPFHLGTWYVKL